MTLLQIAEACGEQISENHLAFGEVTGKHVVAPFWLAFFCATLYTDEGDVAIPCRLLVNGSVECRRYVYASVEEWKAQRDVIDRVLHLYRRRITQLKVGFDDAAYSLYRSFPRWTLPGLLWFSSSTCSGTETLARAYPLFKKWGTKHGQR